MTDTQVAEEAQQTIESLPLSLDSVFEDEPEAEETAEEVEQTPETKAEEPAKEEAKGETEEKSEEAASPAEKDQSVPMSAFLGERDRRQTAEKELETVQAKLAEATKEDEPVPDPTEDPEGYQNYFQDTLKAEALKNKINLSCDLMASLHDDYAEKEATFVDLAKETPLLVHQMNAAPNPAKFAYDHAKQHLLVQERSDPDYEAKLAERIKAELLAEMNGKEETPSEEPKQAEKQSSPALEVPDLTKASAKGSNSAPVETASNLQEICADSPLDKLPI